MHMFIRSDKYAFLHITTLVQTVAQYPTKESFAVSNISDDSIVKMSAYAVVNKGDLDETDPDDSLVRDLNEITVNDANAENNHAIESSTGMGVTSDDEASIDYDPIELASIIGIIDCGSYMMKKAGRAGLCS